MCFSKSCNLAHLAFLDTLKFTTQRSFCALQLACSIALNSLRGFITPTPHPHEKTWRLGEVSLNTINQGVFSLRQLGEITWRTRRLGEACQIVHSPFVAQNPRSSAQSADSLCCRGEYLKTISCFSPAPGLSRGEFRGLKV